MASLRATDVIYLEFCKAFDRCAPAPFSLDWRDVDLVDGLLD